MGKGDDDRSIKELLAELDGARRWELVAGVVGLAVLPVAYFYLLPLAAAVNIAILVSLVLMGGSVAAAAVAVATIDWGTLNRRQALAIAGRVGAKTGLFVFLIGGGMAVLAKTIDVLVEGVGPGETDWVEPSVLAVFAVFLMLLPTIAVGSLTAILVAMTQVPEEFVLEPSPAPKPAGTEPSPSRAKTLLPWALAIFLGSIFSPVVPDFLASRPEKVTRSPESGSKAKVIENAPAPEESREPVPAPPEFQYVAPEGLSTAGAAEWVVTERKTIPEFNPRGPAMISPDESFLAYRPSTIGIGLSILDLSSHKIVGNFWSIPEIRQMTWSPDSKRVFCVCLSSEVPLWVLDLTTGRAVSLPTSRDWARVTGDCWWWAENEVAFVGGKRDAQWLDLETLRFKPIKDSLHWKSVGAEDGAPELPRPRMPETAGARLEVSPIIQRYVSPHAHGDSTWDFDGVARLCVVDKSTGHPFPLVEGRLPAGSRILATSDASRIIVISGGTATTHFIGLEEPEQTSFTARFPEQPDHEPGSRFEDLLNNQGITAFVCAPIVNPLNDRIIGSNRADVRAMVRVISWDDTQAQLVIVDDYKGIRDGDVVTDPHFWEDGHPVLLDGAEFLNWQARISKSDPPVDPTDLAVLTRWPPSGLVANATGLEFDGWSPTRFPPGDAARILTTLTSKETSAPDEEDENPVAADLEAAERIEQFVRRHHEKISQKDLEGFARDYADEVEFYDKGRVTREFIRKDQAAYFPKYLELSERVVKKAFTKQLKPDLYRTEYPIRYAAVRAADRSRTDRVIWIRLDIRITKDGALKIVAERSLDI